MKYYSQFGQDKWIHENLFKDKNDGFFVEIGADDGIDKSNTKFFEELGWSGICIEPSPRRYNFLSENRNCICENVAISNTNKTVDFMDISGYGKGLSGIINNYSPMHEHRIKQEIKHAKNKGYEIIKVACVTLNSILIKHNITHVDFLSIDTEGSELDALNGIDFSSVQIKSITIENNYKDQSIDDFLTNKGYKKIMSLNVDDIYINDKP